MGRGRDEAIIIGGGIGGLVAAALLAAKGMGVTLLEKQADIGGKIRRVAVNGVAVDAGPTVFTLKSVFEDIFDACGASLADAVPLAPLDCLARHAWPDGSRLDLFADHAASRDGIAAFAGETQARGFDSFSAEAAAIWNTLDGAFVRQPKTGPLGLTLRLGLARLASLQAVRPYESLWQVLGQHFADPRLRQLFGRYATYCGCSPFQAPATLMLIAHVEAAGVWRVEGGLHRVASALASLATRHGAEIRTNAMVDAIEVQNGRVAGVRLAGGERLHAAQVIANCDPSAIGSGRFGTSARRAVAETPPHARALSSLTWMLLAQAEGPPLAHHNVFFSGDYRAEFRDIAAGRLPTDPSVYVCAQDEGLEATAGRPQRFQVIVNAPALGDSHPLRPEEIETCESAMLNCLRRSGLSLRYTPDGRVPVTPTDYERLFPSTGGGLYGRASHGALGSFLRPGSRTRIPGLYLAGGGTHPGAGVPMAAISGRLATEAVLADLPRFPSRTHPARRDSTAPWSPAAMLGGMSTPSPTTAAMASPSSPSSAPSSRPIM